MSTSIPPLDTPRLQVRPFEMADLTAVHQLFDHDSGWETLTRAERERWLQWATLNHEQLARLYQPPYGDRAIVLKATNDLIGSVGLVPTIGPFARLPSLGGDAQQPYFETAMGLFWLIAPAHRGQGYAAEAARAMIDHMFTNHHMRRIVATTEYDNVASQKVMQKLGMKLERNPLEEPPWFQVVGVLENDR